MWCSTQQQHMLVGPPTAQTDAPAAAARPTDRSPARRSRQRRRNAGLVEPTHLKPQPRRRSLQDLLPRHPEPLREQRPQALVPPDQIAQRASSAARSSTPLTAAPPAGSHRCARPDALAPACRLQPVQEPQPPLRIGQRDLRRTRQPHKPRPHRLPPADDSRRASAATLGASNRLRIAHLDLQHRPHPADQPRRQQRVPAELEEVVVDADPRTPSTSANSPHSISSCGVRGARCSRAATQPPAQAARGGRACRSASAAAAPAPQAPTAPCSPAAAATAPHEAPQHPAADRRARRTPPPHSRPAAGSPTPPSAPRHHHRLRHARPAAAAQPRSRQARSGTRAASPAHRPAPETPAPRPPRHRARSPVRYIRSPANAMQRAMRVGHKPLRRQTRTRQIAPRQPHARNVKLPNNPRRHRLKTTVQNIRPRVPDRTADRHLGASGRRRRPSASRRSRLRSARTGSPAEPAADAATT